MSNMGSYGFDYSNMDRVNFIGENSEVASKERKFARLNIGCVFIACMKCHWKIDPLVYG